MKPSTVLNLIAAAIIAAFVLVWAAVLVRAWLPADDLSTQLELDGGLTAAAGAVSTLLAARTASVLGFTVGKATTTDGQTTPAAIAKRINRATYAAIWAYLLVGAAVIVTWILREGRAPEIVTAFALSLLGWLSAGAAVAFAAPKEKV